MTKQQALPKNPDRAYLDLLNDVSFQPIFIMGSHRSGTTLLYSLLGTTRCFNVVQAYHVIHYQAILWNHIHAKEKKARDELNTFLKQAGQGNRVIDEVKVSADLVEEYGFVLRTSLLPPRLRPANLPSFIDFCRKVQFVSDREKPLLLKNPWDSTNFIYLKSAFPNAKFIFVHRDPIHTISSQIKAARALNESKSRYHTLLTRGYEWLPEQEGWQLNEREGWRDKVMSIIFSPDHELALWLSRRNVRRATRYFLQNLERLTPGDYTEVRYEDLCEEPSAAIGEILQFLGLRDESGVDYQAYVRPRPPRIGQDVARLKPKIDDELRAYRRYCNYVSDSSARSSNFTAPLQRKQGMNESERG